MVALADMIAVLDNSYFHFFSWYACSLQGATNIVIHVTPSLEYYAPCTIHKQLPKIIDWLRRCST